MQKREHKIVNLQHKQQLTRIRKKKIEPKNEMRQYSESKTKHHATGAL